MAGELENVKPIESLPDRLLTRVLGVDAQRRAGMIALAPLVTALVTFAHTPGATDPATFTSYVKSSLQGYLELSPADYREEADGTDWSPAVNRALLDSAVRQLPVRITDMLACETDLILVPHSTLASACSPGGSTAGHAFLNLPSGIVLNPAASVRLREGATFRSMALLRKGVFTPASTRDNVNQVAAFAGTAIINEGHDTTVEDNLILGFNTAYTSSTDATTPGGYIRPRVRNNFIDAHNGILLNHIHDVGHVGGNHCWPFLTAITNFDSVVSNIQSVTNQGGNLYRVVTSTPHGCITGDKVYAVAIGGALGANGRWTVTKIDNNTLDLNNSAVGFQMYGILTTGSKTITSVSSFANLRVGQTITTPSLPAGCVIEELRYSQNTMIVSVAATASGVAPLTIGNAAYSGGGQIYLNAYYRTGPSLSFTNCETMVVMDHFSFGNAVGIYFGQATQWCQVYGPSADYVYEFQDWTVQGFVAVDTARMNFVVGGSTSSLGEAVICSTSNSAEPGLTVVGASLNIVPNPVAANLARIDQGRLSLIGCQTSSTCNIFCAPPTSGLVVSGCTFPNVSYKVVEQATNLKILIDGLSEPVVENLVPVPSSGSLGSYTCRATYRAEGRDIIRYDELRFTIPPGGLGSASGDVRIPLPFPPKSGFLGGLHGVETASNGWVHQGRIIAGDNSILVKRGDNASALANNVDIALSGSYRR